MPTPTPTIVQPPSNTPYLVAVVIMLLMTLGTVMGILLIRPGQDNTQLIATVVGMMVPTIAAILAFMKSQETHLSVNSRLDDFMTEHAARAKTEGLIQGAADEQSRMAAIAAVGVAPASTIQLQGAVTLESPTVPDGHLKGVETNPKA